jgi:hypothetical protein
VLQIITVYLGVAESLLLAAYFYKASPSPELLIVLCATTHHVEIALQIITVDLGAAGGLPLAAY